MSYTLPYNPKYDPNTGKWVDADTGHLLDIPDNKNYVIAVNADGTYPSTRESQMIGDVVMPEIQSGYLTTGQVYPDGQIVPHEMPTPPPPPTGQSLYYTETTWGYVSTLTWQQVNDDHTW